MPSRSYSTDKYRYGFNGKEKDKDISAGDLDFGARIYDGRVGRWLSTDPWQAKLPGISPYNFCYNNPINIIDPDGKLGIKVTAKYDVESGKYTIVKIVIDGDLRAVPYSDRTGKVVQYPDIGMNYFDYIDITVVGENGKQIVEKSKSKILSFRTNNWIFGKWAADNDVDDGIYDGGSGIIWTSEGQTLGSDEKRKGIATAIHNIDLLMVAISATKGLDDHPISFKGSDILENFVEKLGNIISQFSDKKTGEIDLNDPAIKASIEAMNKLLAGYEDKKEESNSQTNTTSTQKPKRKEVIIRKATSGSVTGKVSTKYSQDPNGTDTTIKLYHPEPKKKAGNPGNK